MALFGGGGLGIDLGSSFTSIILSGGSDVALREPTRALVNATNAREVLAVGEEAARMAGRTAGSTELISPVERGAIADADMAALVMVALAEKATGKKKPMDKALLAATLAGGATNVERAALFQAMALTGARRMAAVRTPVAAALGIGLDIGKPRGVLLMSVGGGASEIAVLSMDGIVALRMLRFGADDMDEAVVRWFWREKEIVISLRTAEQLKREAGTVEKRESDDAEPVLLKGRAAATGQPTTIEVTAQDVRRALEEPMTRLLDATRNALYNIPSELNADIRESGMYLTGGGARLNGFRERLEAETGLAVHADEHMELDAALGLGEIVSDDRLLNRLIKGGAAETGGE